MVVQARVQAQAQDHLEFQALQGLQVPLERAAEEEAVVVVAAAKQLPHYSKKQTLVPAEAMAAVLEKTVQAMELAPVPVKTAREMEPVMVQAMELVTQVPETAVAPARAQEATADHRLHHFLKKRKPLADWAAVVLELEALVTEVEGDHPEAALRLLLADQNLSRHNLHLKN